MAPLRPLPDRRFRAYTTHIAPRWRRTYQLSGVYAEALEREAKSFGCTNTAESELLMSKNDCLVQFLSPGSLTYYPVRSNSAFDDVNKYETEENPGTKARSPFV